MRVVDLAETPVVETPYGRWQPLNERLALGAFGVNAVVLDPGEAMDIEHDEEGDAGQEELYVVVSGRIVFTAGSEEVEAGPGTVIAVPEPATRRSYRALEPGTRLVCIGAPAAGRDRVGPSYGAWIAEGAEGS